MGIEQKVSFPNGQGQILAGKLHLPEGSFRGAALFAHCFTCSKDIFAERHIAGALAMAGIAVLRFDFTGLGQSEGAFCQTSFTSNLDDLKVAAAFMATQEIDAHNLAPQILIGHSLGGAAVLAVAPEIESAKAVVTIGAPAEPGHALGLFSGNQDEILEKGFGEVSIGGRPFQVGTDMIKDFHARLSVDHISRLSHDLLILHSPIDEIVGIDNAAMIFQAARHPKSFISLDRADHLLSRAEDASFAADMISAWARRCLGKSAGHKD